LSTLPTDLFHRDDEELSDADSDYMNVQSNIAKFKDSVRKSKALDPFCDSDEEIHTEHGEVYGRGRARGRGRPRGPGRGRGSARGPRKAAQPTGDIKLRLGRASQAFIEERYDEAMDMVSDVIRINAETHEAWMLLASIFKELGDVEKTLTALMCAAHLRPKDVGGWLSCAQFALEETGDLRAKFLVTAKLCYQSAIRANPKNDIEARCGKAAVLRELGNPSSAISEYKRVLSQRPHDTTLLRLLAEVYLDHGDAEAAKELYRQSISYYQSLEAESGQDFGWSDINIYVELYAYLGQYDLAIKELKSLARWALGRQEESWWDRIVDNDAEWDADDLRRVKIKEFIVGRFDTSSYGKGLPLELRVKLGLYRLRLHNNEEAMVQPSLNEDLT
jgi:general transcription factor 3C polypeptide 3 (transcription factor C subunit 4)